MPITFIEERRRLKRLRKLPLLKPEDIVQKKAGRGNAYQYTKTGHRNDLGLVLRSSWEANLARVLHVHGIVYEFEPKVFYFDKIKRGTKAYTPDFYLPKTGEWIEVKGYMDDKSRIKLKRFKIYYPEEFAQLHLIISKYSKKSKQVAQLLGPKSIIYYEDLSTEYKELIPNWEGR